MLLTLAVGEAPLRHFFLPSPPQIIPLARSSTGVDGRGAEKKRLMVERDQRISEVVSREQPGTPKAFASVGAKYVVALL